MNDTPTPRTNEQSGWHYDEMGTRIEYVTVGFASQLERELTTVTEQRDRLAEAVNAATVLIAAKGRHNTMLAYEGLRKALQSLTPDQP
jgi:hypothetical protein